MAATQFCYQLDRDFLEAGLADNQGEVTCHIQNQYKLQTTSAL